MEGRSTISASSESRKSNPTQGKEFEHNLARALELNLPIENFRNEVINNSGEYWPILFQLKLNLKNDNFIKYAIPLQTQNLQIETDKCFTFKHFNYQASFSERKDTNGKNEIYVKIQTGENNNKEFSLYLNKKNEYYSFCWYLCKEQNDYFIKIFNTSKLILNKIRNGNNFRSYFNWKKYHSISRRLLQNKCYI